MRDLISNIAALSVIAPAVQAATVKSATVDLLGFNSVAFVISTGVIASAGSFSAKVQESDTDVDGDFTDAAASAVTGTVENPLTADDVFKLGYIGFKRFTRVVLTKASGTSIAAGVVAIKSDASQRPVA